MVNYWRSLLPGGPLPTQGRSAMEDAPIGDERPLRLRWRGGLGRDGSADEGCRHCHSRCGIQQAFHDFSFPPLELAEIGHDPCHAGVGRR